MKKMFRIHALVVVVLVCLFAVEANAQIGTGWTAYSPSFSLQIRGCGASSGLSKSPVPPPAVTTGPSGVMPT